MSSAFYDCVRKTYDSYTSAANDLDNAKERLKASSLLVLKKKLQEGYKMVSEPIWDEPIIKNNGKPYIELKMQVELEKVDV